jgi:hypothetical protein
MSSVTQPSVRARCQARASDLSRGAVVTQRSIGAESSLTPSPLGSSGVPLP